MQQMERNKSSVRCIRHFLYLQLDLDGPGEWHSGSKDEHREAAIPVSSTAFAQDAPKVGSKPLAQVKPKEPMGCKLVGTVKGTKLRAGDCVGPEHRGAASKTDAPPLAERATGAIPPGQK
jgi:hypothetical protein